MSTFYNLKTDASEAVTNESTEFLVKPSLVQGKRFSGWRFGVVSCACSSFFVFSINLSASIWALRATGIPKDGRGILFDGSCTKIRPLNVGVHLMINILSTILLSASNYCMQCLSAPTRLEVDKVHAKRKWLDIGVPSIKNLRHISGKRVTLWWLLGLSSLPLHLFYNSAVFSSISANDYSVLQVNQQFASGAELGTTSDDNSTLSESLHAKISKGGFARLDNLECIDAYATPFLTTYGNLLLVINNSSSTLGDASSVGTNSIIQPLDLGDYCSSDPYPWICPGVDDCITQCPDLISSVKANATEWAPFGQVVDHCMAEIVEEHCKLQFSFHIAALVILLNLFKAIIMCLAVIGVRDTPLMTIGDAISSYIQRPDIHTEGMCLLSKKELKSETQSWVARPQVFSSSRQRWSAAASGKRWTTCLVMYALAISLVASLLGFGITQINGKKDIGSLIRLGVGAITPNTFIKGWNIPSSGVGGLIGNVLVANAAQPILSFLYFSINGLFTTMLAASEWSLYAAERKGLRVSASPIGSQRSTYTLQLPYRYSLPLMVLSGLLHWLVSQSIFLVSVEDYDFIDDEGIHDDEFDYMTCGYSPVAMFCVVVAGIVLVLGVILIGRRRFSSAIPIAGSCSAAIAAACQPGAMSDEDAAFKPVQWGVTNYRDDGVGHCAFSSYEVERPEDGQLYAGIRQRL